MYCCLAPVITLSTACDGGARDGLIDESRNSKLDCWALRSGRKAWITVKGARILLFKTSDHSGEEMLTIAEVEYVGGGRRMKADRWSLWAAEFGMGWCGVFKKFVSFCMVSSVDEGFLKVSTHEEIQTGLCIPT